MLRSVHAVRYVLPFRQGGSVPALVEADDLGLYVVKLRGASQGPKAVAGSASRAALTVTTGAPEARRATSACTAAGSGWRSALLRTTTGWAPLSQATAR